MPKTTRSCRRRLARARDTARLGGPEPAGDDPLREVRAARTSEPAEGSLRARRDRSQTVDAGRPGRRVCCGVEAAARPDRGPFAGGGSSAGRRRAVRRPGPAGGAVPLLAGSLGPSLRPSNDGACSWTQTKGAQLSTLISSHSRWRAVVGAGPCPGRGGVTALLRVPRAAPRRRERSSHIRPAPRADRDAPHQPAR